MKVGTGGNLGLSREYNKKLFWPLFYTWWNCPLSKFMNPFQVRVKDIHIGTWDTGKGAPLSMNGLTKVAYIITNLHQMYH